jgi:hypothetical protein
MKPSAYVAYTDACTFFLDEDGICLRVVLTGMPWRASEDVTLGGRTRADAAERCVGAQYVASIDRGVVGGLVPMPQPGAPLLFAYLGNDGRIAVVRTGPLVRFEPLDDTRDTIVPDLVDDTLDESHTVPVPRLHGLGRPGSAPRAIHSPRDSAPTWKGVQPPRASASSAKR